MLSVLGMVDAVVEEGRGPRWVAVRERSVWE
jgi:hypothetical protein